MPKDKQDRVVTGIFSIKEEQVIFRECNALSVNRLLHKNKKTRCVVQADLRIVAKKQYPGAQFFKSSGTFLTVKRRVLRNKKESN